MIKPQYVQIVFIVKREKHHFYASQKDNDHHCKEFGCKCIQYFEQ